MMRRDADFDNRATFALELRNECGMMRRPPQSDSQVPTAAAGKVAAVAVPPRIGNGRVDVEPCAPPDAPATFALELQTEPNQREPVGVRMRFVLKRLLRRYGFKCVRIVETKNVVERSAVATKERFSAAELPKTRLDRTAVQAKNAKTFGHDIRRRQE